MEVSFTHWPPYPQGWKPLYPLNRRPGWPQSWSGRRTCPCQESNPYHPAHTLVTILTELFWELDEKYNCHVIQGSTSIISNSSHSHRHHSSIAAARAVAVTVFNVQALQGILTPVGVLCTHTQ